MSQANIDRLIAGTLPDPDGGPALSVPVRAVVVGTGLAESAVDLVAPLGLGKRLAVVMDPDTARVLGEAVAHRLADAHAVSRIMLGPHPHPDMPAVLSVMDQARDADGLVAVGSGSINDITKHAAHLLGRPYAVFGTAPSMNGYTSVSAAITEDGLKKSLSSTAPRGVFLDLDVLAAAPRRLIAAGLGDSICRSTAQVDWLMCHLVRGTRYREAPFFLLADEEPSLVANAGRLVEGDRQAIAALARTLILSGFGMTICGGSYPASQSEHLVVHYIDMLGQNLPLAYHGEHVAVTTLTAARLQERLLARDNLTIRANRDTLELFTRQFGAALGASCWAAFLPKRLDDAGAAALQKKLDGAWPEIRRRLRAVARPAGEIERALMAVGAPTTPQAVGIPLAFYREALLNARRIRDRFGFLDLAEAAGELDAFVAGETGGAQRHA
jgi:glycerol-1-phosphate dehydrogenase [NAD(P)+]